MFHVNETLNDQGTLTVKNGVATIHVSLAGDGVLNVFQGTAEEAQKEGAKIIEPTEDTGTYDDGSTEVVNGFDIPVPVIGEEFDVAIIGKKGKWYDHKVKVELAEDASADIQLKDGEYTVKAVLSGGTGKASVTSPAEFTVEDGQATVYVEFSSDNYDYAIWDDVKYTSDISSGLSVFAFPLVGFDVEIPFVADTTAMSKPHEIEYTICFDSSTIEEK